jgi:hypothetical protein
MQNQTQTGNQHFTNAAFATLFDSITAKLPSLTFWAIIFSYAATAGLNCWAIHLPLYLSVPLALAIQSLRFLCVFTPFLNPSGRAGHLPEVIAVGASLLALFELSFSLRAMGEADDNFWSLFLFGAAIVVLSMVLELQFISAGKKAFGLTGEKRQGQTGAVKMQQAQQVDTADDATAMQDENTFLRNQVAQLKNDLGNGKPGRPKKQIPSELLNGHSSNGNGNGKH